MKAYRNIESVKIPAFLPSVSMHKIRAILFDLDNTLIDFIRMKEESCRAAVKAMVASGLQMEEDQAFELLMKTYFDVGIESNIAFSEFLKSIDQFDHKILASGINTYLKTKNKFLKPYPNVKSVLGKLKRRGVILSIVTDAPKTKAYQRLLGMGIEPYFKFVVGHEDTNKSKHTGLPLLLALEMLRKEMPGHSKLGNSNGRRFNRKRHSSSQKTWVKNSTRQIWTKNPRDRIRRLPAFRFQRNH